MRFLFLALIVAILFGCGCTVTSGQWHYCEAMCAANGGVDKLTDEVCYCVKEEGR
jgi:hypothetical protein